MNRHPFDDTATHDTSFKKVFFRHSPYSRTAASYALSIIYIYCHKSHKCQYATRTGLSSVTVQNCLLSSVTTFPILGTADRCSLFSVLSPHLATL